MPLTVYNVVVSLLPICLHGKNCFMCSDDDYNLALTDGAFSKLIQVQLVRKIEGEQFFGVSASLAARLRIYFSSCKVKTRKQRTLRLSFDVAVILANHRH